MIVTRRLAHDWFRKTYWIIPYIIKYTNDKGINFPDDPKEWIGSFRSREDAVIFAAVYEINL